MPPRKLLTARTAVLLSDSTRMACELLVQGVRAFARDLEVVGAVTSARELIAVAERTRPDVALISTDLEDGPGTGLVAARELHIKHPQIACVVLMDERSRRQVVDAFCAGARGVIFRSEPSARLLECLRNVRNGQIWAGSAEIEQIVQALTTAIPVRAVGANGNELLTSRQKQIVGLVAEGLTNREIAERLTLSENTVKNYLFRIFDKLGVSSRAELIIYAIHQDRLTA